MQYKKGRKSPWMVQYRDNSGKVQTKSFVRKQDAEAFEQAEKRKKQLLSVGLQAPEEGLLLLDYAKIFLTRRFKKLARGTFNQDESRLKNYWLEKFGMRPLATITTPEIKQHLDFIEFELEHKPADRNRHRALLHRLFKEAVLDQKILFNPVAAIPLEDEKTPKGTRFKSDADLDKYLAGLRAEGSSYWMLGMIMVWTGARISEAIALQHHDVDFDNGVVYLRRIFERASQSLQNRTKGDGEGEQHLVPLFPQLKDAILTHKRTSLYTRPTDFIATRQDGKHIAYETFMDVQNRIFVAAKIDRVTPHGVRRTFATNAKKAGYTRAEIREMLGQSSEQVTARYDLEDIEHLVEKGKRLGFGGSGVSEMKRRKRKVG